MNISNRRCDSGDWAISGCWTRNFHGSVKAPDARQDIAALGVVAVALVVCLAAWHRFFMIPNSHQSALVDVGECWYSMVSFHTFFPIYCQKTPNHRHLLPANSPNSQRCSGLFSLLLGIRRSDRVWPTSSAKSLGCDAAKPTENKLYRLWTLDLSSCRTWGSSTFFWLRTKPHHFRIVPLGAFFKGGMLFFFLRDFGLRCLLIYPALGKEAVQI